MLQLRLTMGLRGKKGGGNSGHNCVQLYVYQEVITVAWVSA